MSGVSFCFFSLIMSMYNYFAVKDGLPDPKGSLSSQVSSRPIALANKEVKKELQKKKRGKYNR